MRKNNEQLVAAYTVNVYAPSDKVNDPSGAGATPGEFSQELTGQLKDEIQSHLTEQIAEAQPDWSDDLRCEVFPIT